MAVIALNAAFLAPDATAKARLPAPIFKALIRVNGDLQVGIEEAPAVLIKDLGSSNTACGKALESEKSGGNAQANWMTLTEIIERGDIPASRAIISALARTHTDLGDLRAVFSQRWRDQPAKVKLLVLAVAQMQEGVHLLQVAVKSFGIAFDRWEQHDCAGAQEAITATNKRISSAIQVINHGIGRTAAILR